MTRQASAIAVILISIALGTAAISCEKPHSVESYSGVLPPFRFIFDRAEACQLDSNLPGFVIEDSFTGRSGFHWDVHGYFFYFDRDFYLEVLGKEWGGHQGDIEGAWILNNHEKGIVVTALSTHSYLQVRTNPSLGKEGYLDFFVERGKHGIHYEAGVYYEFVIPFIADGEGESFTHHWFDSKPVYSGSDGAQALKERFLSSLNLSGAPRTLRVEPIIYSLENHTFYLGILDAASAGKEKVNIRALSTPE